MAIEAPHAPSGGPTWLHGRVPDLLLGAGVAYLLSVPLFWLVARNASAGDWPLALTWVLAVLVAGPHYGATLLRVYGDRQEREKYALFAVWATLLLLGVFAVGVYRPFVGSLLVTVYFTWSPWHFASQNYGISLMFLRRSGIAVAPRAKRLLHASFLLSFALTVLALNVEGSSSFQAPTRSGYSEGAELLRLGVPAPIAAGAMLVCGAAYLLSLAGVAASLRREATPRQLLPVASLVLCQALWFSVPSVLDLTGGWSARALAFAAIWISAAHAVQYLWVTSYYAKQGGTGGRLPGYLLKATLAGNAAFVLPAIVFAPGLLGRDLSFDAGLATLVFALVNVHHFVLDGAVWKLRDGRVARALLGGGGRPQPAGPPRAAPRRGWRVALWLTCAACLGVEAGELARRGAERWGAHGVAAALLDGLAPLGRDHARARIRIGRALLERGDFAGAAAQFERSLGVAPSVAAWGGLGRARAAGGDPGGAAEAYESGLALDPDDLALLRSAGFARLRQGETERAAQLLARALEREPADERTRRALERARPRSTP